MKTATTKRNNSGRISPAANLEMARQVVARARIIAESNLPDDVEDFAYVDRMVNFFFEMPKPGEPLARAVIAGALRRGLLTGLAIADARMARPVAAGGVM